VRRLLRGTGSEIDAEGLALYARVAGSPGHVASAIAMMAHWDLPALAAALSRLATPVCLIVGDRDRAVPPADAQWLSGHLPRARLRVLPGLGHLAHEERPETVADAIRDCAREVGVAPAAE